MDKETRLRHFFQSDGKTVIVPIDHGCAIPVPGLEHPGAVIEMLNPFADGYVVNLGVAMSCADPLEDKGICLRTDCYKPAAPDNEDEGPVRLFTADEALGVGASAMMNMLYVNHANEGGMLQECAELIGEGLEAEMPVILEVLPYGLGRPEDYTVENIAFASRLAAEIGADVVKTAYPTGASVEEFRAIVDACFVPVIVLGGTAMSDDVALLKMVQNAMAAGARGVAVGRNVWQHPNPAGIAKAMYAVVHEGASAETAAGLV